MCREEAIVLLSAQFFIWPSVSVYIAPVSVRCVAVRAVMQFFQVCLFPVVISVVSAAVLRHVLHHPRILPVVVIHLGVPRIAVPAWSRVLLLPFVPGVAVLMVVLVTARAIVGVNRLLLLLGVVPGLADIVPVSFSVTASIAGDTPCSRRPASVGVCWVARALPGARRLCCWARVITARPLSPLLVIVGVSQAVASPAVQGGVCHVSLLLEVDRSCSKRSCPVGGTAELRLFRALVSFKISILSLHLWNVTISGRG